MQIQSLSSFRPEEQPQLDPFEDANSFAGLLRKCGRSKRVSEGKLLHQRIVDKGLDRGTFLGNLIVQMYGKMGDLNQASLAFANIAHKNVFSWTLMFTAYTQHGHLQEAKLIFDRMPHKDVVAWTAMLAAYAHNGSVSEAKHLFDRIPLKDVVAWNAMLAAYGQNRQYKPALAIYESLLQSGTRPNQTTFVSVLDVCVGLGDLARGEAVHGIVVACGMEVEATVGTALVNMFGKCGSLSRARDILDRMPEKNVVASTAMMAAYAQNGQPRQALNLFLFLDLEGLQPDDLTFVSALNACIYIPAFAVGVLIHQSFRNTEFAFAPSVANTLITFFGQFGRVEEARAIFDGISHQSLLSWNSMLRAYARNGLVDQTLQLFPMMIQDGAQPDEITFVTVLSACSHGGKLSQGCQIFSSIAADFHQSAVEDHCMCVVDILARSGQLEEAESFVSRFKASAGYTTLLGACKLHGDSKRGARAGRKLMLMNEEAADSGPYMLLSNIYADEKQP